jgi:hypothetical protein
VDLPVCRSLINAIITYLKITSLMESTTHALDVMTDISGISLIGNVVYVRSKIVKIVFLPIFVVFVIQDLFKVQPETHVLNH